MFRTQQSRLQGDGALRLRGEESDAKPDQKRRGHAFVPTSFGRGPVRLRSARQPAARQGRGFDPDQALFPATSKQCRDSSGDGQPRGRVGTNTFRRFGKRERKRFPRARARKVCDGPQALTKRAGIAPIARIILNIDTHRCAKYNCRRAAPVEDSAACLAGTIEPTCQRVA